MSTKIDEDNIDIKVSIFLTTYNWPEALVLCVKSIFKQTLLPNEIIIADDGSGEKTKEAVELLKKESPVPIVHVWQPDEGFRLNEIRNKAIKVAKYPYVIQIDGDVILDMHFVSDHINSAKKDRALFGKRIELDGETTKKLCINCWEEAELKSLRNRFLGWIRHFFIYGSHTSKGVNGCNMSYWRRDAYNVNGFDESMQSKGPDDKDFAARLIHSGVKSYYLKFYANCYHLKHGEEGRRPDYEMIKNIYKETLKTKKIKCTSGLENLLVEE